MDSKRSTRSGALAGITSALVFTVIHDVLISDIWFSALPMMIAGGACGASLGWSYSLLIENPSIKNWVRYNLIYDAMFVALGVVSIVMFEPVTTIAKLIEANEMPHALIGQALPLTAGFTLVVVLVLGVLYGTRLLHYGSILVTTVLLVIFLGLNVSVIGLVAIPMGSIQLIVELFGLILAINAVYGFAFAVLERRILNSNNQ
ncbi:hypothetical protein ACFLRO_01135 [Bacteroidota bacterium]